jgi:hypothetical protein
MLIFVSCNAKNKDDIQKKYIIPDSIYNFFPSSEKEYLNLKLIYTSDNAVSNDLEYFSTEFVITHICKIYHFSNLEDIIKLESKYKSKSQNQIKAESNEYFIIGSERDMYERFDSSLIVNKYKNDSVLQNLVPNFYEIVNPKVQKSNSITICGLSKDYKLYILKSNNKLILPEKYKTEWNMLPDQIKHGYQSGVAISFKEEKIIYWAIAW